MTPVQLRALRSWLVARLPLNPSDPANQIDFPAAHVYKQTRQDAPRPRLPICTYLPLGGSTRGSSPEVFQVLRAVLDHVELLALPGADFTFSIEPFNVPDSIDLSAWTFPSITVTPNGNISGTISDMLAQLQALEGPAHPFTYTGTQNNAHAFDFQALDAWKGVAFRIVVEDPASWDQVPHRQPVEKWTRTLAEEQVSIRIETKQSGEDASLPEDAWAYHLAEKLAHDALTRAGWEALACEGVSMLGVTGPIQVSGILGDAQGTEISTLTLRLGVLRYRGEQANTIECTTITGTLDGAEPPITLQSTIEP